MDFKNFLGNDKIKSNLSRLFDSGRLPHAILLEGEDGIGKRTLARELACALVCRSGSNAPCHECAQCRKAEKGVHPDIYFYCPKGGAGSFHVDTVRDVVNGIYMSPNEADYKIYILCNAHFMNASAQNALLKVLEEPPAYGIIILTAVSKAALLETVLSRCAVFSLEGVDASSGARYICEHNENAGYDEALEAMITFNGNIGKASQSLEDGRMKTVSRYAREICLSLVSPNEYDLIKCLGALSKERQEISEVLLLLKTVFRDAAASGGAVETLSGQEQAVEELKRRFSKEKLLKLCSAADCLIDAAGKNANVALLITKMSYSLREAVGR